MPQVYVSGAFDDPRSPELRFLQEAAKLGPVTLVLWPDAAVASLRGTPAKMSLAERRYYFESLRYVAAVEAAPEDLNPDRLSLADDSRGGVGINGLGGRGGAARQAGGGSGANDSGGRGGAARQAGGGSDGNGLGGRGSAERQAGGGYGPGAVWVVRDSTGSGLEGHTAAKAAWCRAQGLELVSIPAADLAGFPYEAPALDASVSAAPKSPAPRSAAAYAVGGHRVVATGCYDWLHTGHLRFFEEAAEYGELNIIIGSDANVRLLKGEGHPLFSENERRYVVGSFKNVTRCLVSSGSGWLDAEPEIRALKADRYVVNEDGDKPEKRRFCEANGIEYIVLKRTPKAGLPRRSSTDLRGY